VTTKGPMWGYPRPVLGAVDPFLEPFRGRLSPNIDNASEKLTLRYPHEGPWVGHAGAFSALEMGADCRRPQLPLECLWIKCLLYRAIIIN